MLSKLRQLFGPRWKHQEPGPQLDDDPELAWLRPPSDPLDDTAWDRYWIEHVKHGLGPPIFDMFCDDRNLVAVMNAEGMQTVLCAGNGISQEPRVLAEAGFRVVALDLSPQAVEIARTFEFPAEAFEYFCESGMRRPEGHVKFVVGDILDPDVCPGPFDVIIERRTAQNYFPHNIGVILGALVKRLGHEGIFFSHCHDRTCGPQVTPRHYTKPWFKENRWKIWDGGPGRKPPGRVAWLFTSTG